MRTATRFIFIFLTKYGEHAIYIGHLSRSFIDFRPHGYDKHNDK